MNPQQFALAAERLSQRIEAVQLDPHVSADEASANAEPLIAELKALFAGQLALIQSQLIQARDDERITRFHDGTDDIPMKYR